MRCFVMSAVLLGLERIGISERGTQQDGRGPIAVEGASYEW